MTAAFERLGTMEWGPTIHRPLDLLWNSRADTIRLEFIRCRCLLCPFSSELWDVAALMAPARGEDLAAVLVYHLRDYHPRRYIAANRGRHGANYRSPSDEAQAAMRRRPRGRPGLFDPPLHRKETHDV